MNFTGASTLDQWYLIVPNYFFMVITILMTIIILHWLFFIPCSWRKDINHSSHILNAAHLIKLKSDKQASVNRLRRSRLTGLKELPPPFPNGWFSILESSLLKPQNVKYVSCLGEHFLVFRTKDGQVNVLDAYCPHLGANIGIGGQVKGDNIECPFHQWTFRGSDGTCMNIPYSLTDAKSTKVRRWMCRETNDNIFVWYHSESEKIQWELPVITAIENKEIVFHGRNEFFVSCHIQDIPENGADMAHFSAVHRACLLTGMEYSDQGILAKYGKHHWQSVWNATALPISHLAELHLKHYFQLIPKCRLFHIDVKATQIGPAYVHLRLKSSMFGSMEILQTVTPVEPLMQHVVHRFYAHKALGPLVKIMILAESIMFERDIAVWNYKTFWRKPQLVKEDTSIKKFRKWFSQFYTENSKSFAEACATMNW
ncbi:cholesterol 7-desaturase nvd isoform X2 [Eurosta solidaginis]